VTSTIERIDSVAVVIPTRNRPQKLKRCLDALELARGRFGSLIDIYVCDSSDTNADKQAGRNLCANFDRVHWSEHEGIGVSAARNACAQAADADLLINVDDDVCMLNQKVFVDSTMRI